MAKKIYIHLEEIIGSSILVIMVLIAVVQVVSRYILKEPFSWTEEVCTFLFIWLTFIGAAMALKSGDHFSVDIIADKIPGLSGKIVKLISYFLVLIFTVLIISYGIKFTITGSRAVTPTLEVPRSVPYAAIPFGGVLMLIRTVESIFRTLKTVFTEKQKT